MSRLALKPACEQVAVITGASSGIGLLAARTLAAAGAKVVLVARNGTALERIATDIEEKGGAAAFAVADVYDQMALRRAAAVALDHFGRIDTWVNCAGVAIYGALVETPLAEHERLFQTNYFGVVNGSQVAVEHLREQGGALITVGSIAGDMPSPVMGAYTASKHAVKGFIESLRIELIAANAPIAVTLIKPSGMGTPIAEHAANHVAGAALVPPPVYDPVLVAQAILDAAQRPRRNVTVGGFGRVQVLFANLFPAPFARMANLVSPFLIDTRRPPRRRNNLHDPIADGSERSQFQSGRPVSLYRHRRSFAAIAGGLAAIGIAVWSRRRSPVD